MVPPPPRMNGRARKLEVSLRTSVLLPSSSNRGNLFTGKHEEVAKSLQKMSCHSQPAPGVLARGGVAGALGGGGDVNLGWLCTQLGPLNCFQGRLSSQARKWGKKDWQHFIFYFLNLGVETYIKNL